jgi:hypothetical protein
MLLFRLFSLTETGLLSLLPCETLSYSLARGFCVCFLQIMRHCFALRLYLYRSHVALNARDTIGLIGHFAEPD